MKKHQAAFQNFFLFVLIICFQLAGYSQQGTQSREIKPDPRLYDCFTKDYIDGLQNNPKLLAYYNFYLDHSYFISEGGSSKGTQAPDITTIPAREKGSDGKIKYFAEDLNPFNAKNFNPLKYDFQTKADNYTHFTIGNTGKILIFYSNKDFTKKYQEYLKSINLE